MNVTRSTLMRRGHVLTALTVAALLAGSAGSAWAQTIGFRTSRATLEEGASTNAATPAPLKVTITRSGIFDKPDGEDEGTAPDATLAAFVGDNPTHLALEVVEYDGQPTSGAVPFTITARSGDTGSWTVTPLTTGSTVSGSFGFGAETSRTDKVANTIELTIGNSDPDDGDWNPETLVLKLHAIPALDTHLTSNDTDATPRTVRFSTRQLTVTVEDDDPMPKLKFSPPGIQLAEGNMLTMTAGVGIGGGGRGSLPTGTESIRATLAGFTGAREDVLLSVSPPEAVGTLIQIWRDDGDGMLEQGEGIEPDGQGRYNIGKIGDDGSDATPDGAVGAVNSDDDDGITLTIKAIDVSGFRDERITFTLMEGRTEAQKLARGGIDDSDPATVTLLSGEETPTVTFSTESVTMNEGDTETVHLLADGEQGDQVGAVAISVSGDATIVLEQGGSPISGGVVQFGDSANAELTIRSLEDVRLEDGEEKMATVTITDASGANIGDPRTLTITVVGSTAVPVLPLVGQLLLGLLLTAGGARLYRRRQR